MNKILLITTFLISLTLSSIAQTHPRSFAFKSDKVQIERIAFFSERISLTSEEAQLFWPIYNEMDAQRSKLFDKRAELTQKASSEIETLSDKEATEILKNIQQIHLEEAKLYQKYYDKFSKILSPQKLLQLHLTEHEFIRYLLKKMKENKG